MTPTLRQRAGHARQALHAHAVELAHPLSGETLEVRAPIPPDMQALWDGQ